jgi:nucleotide-binding universal stress UspA family protein
LLLAHVQRHGRSATFEIIDRQGRPPEDALLDEVARTNPDLVVMGAYGHTHSMEFVFGGVTSNMLHRSRVPLLMAH